MSKATKNQLEYAKGYWKKRRRDELWADICMRDARCASQQKPDNDHRDPAELAKRRREIYEKYFVVDEDDATDSWDEICRRDSLAKT